MGLKFTFAILGLTDSNDRLFVGSPSQSILGGTDVMATPLEEVEEEAEALDDFNFK